MALIISAFLLNLFSLYLKFVFTQYITVIEHYSMNEVELTNMLPHMKVNLRNHLFNNAIIALNNAGNILHNVNDDFYEQQFGQDTPNQTEITIQRNGPHGNVEHIVTDADASAHHYGHVHGNGHANGGQIPNYFTQEVNHYGYGTNEYIYKVKWQLGQNLDNVEYVEMFSYNQEEKFAIFTQNIRHETNDGNILVVYQRRIQHYNIV